MKKQSTIRNAGDYGSKVYLLLTKSFSDRDAEELLGTYYDFLMSAFKKKMPPKDAVRCIRDDIQNARVGRNKGSR